MGAPHHVVGPHDPGAQVRVGEVRAGIRVDVRVERDVAALGGHHDLVASKLGARDALGQHGADHALAPLVSIVHGGVDDVEAALERLTDGAAVEAVGRGILAAQVGPQAQARQVAGGVESAIVVGRDGGGESLRVARRTLGSRAALDHDQATR